jgi:predicted dehydrogenase
VSTVSRSLTPEAYERADKRDEAGLRIAVVGCGYWGSKHLRVMQSLEDVDSVMAVDQDASRLISVLRNNRDAPCVSSVDDALPYVDALVIATPPATHVDVALVALRAGKHVLVEKPLATTVSGALQLINAAHDSGATLMVGHTFEYNSAVWTLRDLITKDALGCLYYIDSARLNLGLYQSDVNVIFDLAPHDISIANHLLGTLPSAVEAWASRHAHTRMEDVAYLRLHYADLGVEANIHVSWLDPHKVRRVTAVGSEKMAVYNDTATDERIRIYDKGVVISSSDELSQPPMTYRYGDIISPHVDFREPLVVQDEHFVRCICKREMPRTDGANGLAVVRVLEAAQMSLQERQPIYLSEIPGEQPARSLALSAGA